MIAKIGISLALCVGMLTAFAFGAPLNTGDRDYIQKMNVVVTQGVDPMVIKEDANNLAC